MFIRPALESDAEAIANIYNHYITETVVTFETEPVTAEIMQERIQNIQAKYTWIVAEHEDEVIGYAYLHAWNARCAFFQTAETSIYLHKEKRQAGTGTLLYTELIKQAKDLKLHALIAAIASPYEQSERFHQKMGFEQIGLFKETGFKFGEYRDVAYYELLLN